MKIEKINDNKIRIFFDIDDLHEKNIDFNSFMSNSIESQKLFLDMLDEAKNKIGFVTDDYKVLIETAVTDDGNFVCNLTRITPNSKKDTLYSKSNVHIKRKKASYNSNVTVYAFNTFDDFIAFCNFFVNNFSNVIDIFSKNSKLYSFNSIYYLVLDNICADLELLESFCAGISEFALFISNSNCFDDKLLEYGELVIDKNAILTVSRYFV